MEIYVRQTDIHLTNRNRFDNSAMICIISLILYLQLLFHINIHLIFELLFLECNIKFVEVKLLIYISIISLFSFYF